VSLVDVKMELSVPKRGRSGELQWSFRKQITMGTPLWWADEGRVRKGCPLPLGSGGITPGNFFKITDASSPDSNVICNPYGINPYIFPIWVSHANHVVW
jgi:hypothetical protein